MPKKLTFEYIKEFINKVISKIKIEQNIKITQNINKSKI
jgi:hypothetical protein